MFLAHGGKLHVYERLFRFKPICFSRSLLRFHNHGSIFQEELWNAYFLILKICNKTFKNQFFSQKRKVLNQNNLLNYDYDSFRCCICKDEPKISYRSLNYGKIDNCNHIFCYLCIKRKLVRNAHFKCYKCLYIVNYIEMLVKEN